MDYLTELTKETDKYDEMLQQYNDEKKTFNLLGVKYKLFMSEYLLNIIENIDDITLMFLNKEEAINLYKDIKNFDKDKQNFLNDLSRANCIVKMEEQINAFVDNSPYLSDSYKVETNNEFNDLIRKELQKIPNIQVDKEFCYKYKQQCVNQFSVKELETLIARKMLTLNNLHHLKYETDAMKEKKDKLFKLFGEDKDLIDEYKDVKLKGTSHYQDTIKNIQDKNVTLTPEWFTPPSGIKEPSVKVTLKDETIGFLSAPLAKKLFEEGKILGDDEHVLTGTISRVTGGGDVNYGCNVNFEVYKYINKTKENDKVKENTKTKEDNIEIC